MLFCAEITEFKLVHNVLKAIAIQELGILQPMEQGLKITVDDLKCVETSAYVPSTMFSFYHIKGDEQIIFKISLKALTEVFNLFGDDGNLNMKFSYKSYGSPLSLVISHCAENITVDCEIKTMNIDEFDNISLADGCDLNKIVINATALLEYLQRLDNSADEIKISLEKRYLVLKTFSSAGESEVTISRDSESVSIFECNKCVEAVYNFHYIRQILKVLHLANKVAILTGEFGLLGLHLFISSDEKQMYVEHYITSQAEED